MSSTFAKLADLPLEIESCACRASRVSISMGFERLTTVVCLHGGGEEGVGEDVDLLSRRSVGLSAVPVPRTWPGSWTLAEFGEHVDGLDLFTTAPLFSAYRKWRRWAFHSAALDLALRQAGRALHEVLEVEPRPMTFVLSTGLGEPPSTEGLRELLGRYPQPASQARRVRLLGRSRARRARRAERGRHDRLQELHPRSR